MYIEKNVHDSIIDTLLDLKEKTKDRLNARLDLKEMKIRQILQSQIIAGKNKVVIPLACYTMSNKDKEVFYTTLKGVKVLNSYGGNISNYVQVKEQNILHMKSHDCHIMMQQILPLDIRNLLSKNVKSGLVELCGFYHDLCIKDGTEDDFKRLGQSVAVILCKLEKNFPPGFFDVMVHLIVHLAYEVSLGGPVQYRWMYPIEKLVFNYLDNENTL